ncbi:unnamed protein product [Closterium sp. NIES-54]
MVQEFGLTEKQEDIGYFAGLLASSTFVGSLLSSFLWGSLSDRIGRRPILLMTQLRKPEGVNTTLRDELFRVDTVCSVLIYDLLGLVYVAYDELFPLWSLSRWDLGGLNLGSNEVGLAQTAGGVSLIPFQLFVYPILNQRLGPTRTLQLGLIFGATLGALPLVRIVGTDRSRLLIAIMSVQMLRRSNNGSSVTSPSRPTASPAADNSHLQQQQQQQYQQQPMYGMPLSSQPVHTTTAAASSTAAAATAASAASTAAAAVPGSSSQPGQQSNFVPPGPYQYQGAYQPANLQQRVNAAVLSLNQMFPTPMSFDGSSYQRGQMPQGSDGSNNSFSFVEEDFNLHLNEVLLVPRLGFNLMSYAQLMKNGITLLGEPGKFTLKYGEKKLGTAVEQNCVFVLNFIPERTTADSDNILSLGPWEHRDDIDYTNDTCRPPTAPLGKFDQRANRLLVPARDCIFYGNLTLPIFEQHLASQQDPATLFHGARSFANADVELAANEEPDSDGAREAALDPPVPVTSSGIPEFIPLADATPKDVRDVHHTYLVDEQRQPMPVVSDSSIRVNPDEIGGGKWRPK